MTGPDAARVYAALHSPSAESLRISLPDMAEGLHAQLYALYANPSPDSAERIAANLTGAARALGRFREALMREGGSDGR